MSIHIGPHQLSSNVLLAPMAGVSDRPFRTMCRDFGAGLTTCEMVSSKPELLSSRKSEKRLEHDLNARPISVQLVGTEPKQLADAARYHVDTGAEIIDINMGCPAKKVCKKSAGSALLADPDLVCRILTELVAAVSVPVTLKIRTGSAPSDRNAVSIARIAEDCGVQALVVHGRTRACRFFGNAEYDTIAEVKASVNIPIIANGDITSPEQAKYVLDYTGADGVMIGRGAQGKPWLFEQILSYLKTASYDELSRARKFESVLRHIKAIHEFYEPELALRFTRKHIHWYSGSLDFSVQYRQDFMRLCTIFEQWDSLLEKQLIA